MYPQTVRVFIFTCILAWQIPLIAQQASNSSDTWNVYFSPRGGATLAIVRTLDDAKSTVLVQAYSFTSAPIAEALVRALARGVKVQVLLDKSQRTQRYTVVDILIQAGIPTLIDASHAIAHNKVMIIDNEIVITGSFNFTKAAEERNAENLLIIRSKQLATIYADNWRFHRGHASSFDRQSRRYN
jgi:phosphatidylserine/phosphatidylglycerophosphate/cardiolipin synthase-like enzyme